MSKNKLKNRKETNKAEMSIKKDQDIPVQGGIYF